LTSKELLYTNHGNAEGVAMYDSFFTFWAWRTYGKWLEEFDRQGRSILIPEDSPLDLRLRFERRERAKEYSRILGKTPLQELHEKCLKMYQAMLEVSTTAAEREYAESHIRAHTKRLEEATEEFQRELEADRNALPS
jgi:hypothetical protein